MTCLLVFATGVAIGVIYEKSIVIWKNKAVRAANAAKEALRN